MIDAVQSVRGETHSMNVTNNVIATFLLAFATSAFCLSMIYTLFPNLGVFQLLSVNAFAALLLGSAGSVGTALAFILYYSDLGQRRIMFMVAAGMVLMAFVRIVHVWLGSMHGMVNVILSVEAVVFLGLSTWLFFKALGDFAIWPRFKDGALSLWRAPRWVFIWVMFILSPVNLAGLFFLDHPLGIAAILGFIYIFLTNVPLLIEARGANSSMSIPHLVPFSLVVALALYVLFASASYPNGVYEQLGSPSDWRRVQNTPLLIFAWALVMVNSISIAFDLNDTRKWIQGNRENL